MQFLLRNKPTKVVYGLPVLQVQTELLHVPWPVHDGCPGQTCDVTVCKI